MEFREKPMQNLMRIKEKEICKNVQALLLDGESIVGAYKTAVSYTHLDVYKRQVRMECGVPHTCFPLRYPEQM